MVRAALEAICFQSRDVLDVMIEEGGVAMPRLNVNGGATANDFLMQLQADILGIPVDRPAITETTSLGAAYAAGLATGYWESEEATGPGSGWTGFGSPQLPQRSATRCMSIGSRRWTGP